MPTFTKQLKIALAIVVASCMSTIVAASQLEYPITIRALAPEFPKQISIQRLPDDADKEALIHTYRLFRPEHQQVFLALRTPSWWLITPRAQPTGGYRLRVRIDGRTAHACLDPPRGPATQAFATPAYFVALPRHVGRVAWQDACAPPGVSCESCPRIVKDSDKPATEFEPKHE